MSDAESTGEPTLDPAKTVYRTLGKPFRARSDAEMDAIGWSLLLGTVILLLPLLPFLLLIWLVTKGLDAVAPNRE